MHRLFLALTACAGLACALPVEAIAMPGASPATVASPDHSAANPLVQDAAYHHRHRRHHHPHA